MFRKQVAILFAIIGIITILGFIIAVAPGYFIKGYALFGVAAGLLLLLFFLLIITALIYEYLNNNSLTASSTYHVRIFHESLSRKQKVILSSISGIFFIGGALFGVLWGLLLKAISVSVAAHIICTAIFIIALLIVLVIILVAELKKFKSTKLYQPSEQKPIVQESKPSKSIFKKTQDGPKNTATRANRYRQRPVDDDLKSTRQNSPIHTTTDTVRTSKVPSTIQTEYQRLLRPSSRFSLNDKVFVNETDLARVIGSDEFGKYHIQYLESGLTDHKNGSELRKALPLID